MNGVLGVLLMKVLQVGLAVVAWWAVLRILDKFNGFKFSDWWTHEALSDDARASYLSYRMLAVAIIFAFGG